MAGLGQIYVELDLDWTPFQKAGERLKAEATAAATTVEGNFKRLGVTSDTVFQAMANKAVLAFDSIKTGGKSSAAEIERSYTAMVAKINALNQDMTKNPLFETLGIRSQAAIEAQKKAVIESYAAIKTMGIASHQDLINMEKAKNDQLKKLDEELMGQRRMSMAGLTRDILRIYASLFVLQQALGFLSVPFIKGFKAVEEYNTAVASMAAMVVTFSENIRNLSFEQQWKGALLYAERIIPVLERIAAKTLLSGQETIALANAFARSGVFLDENNKKQIQSFERISNALPLMTQGQEVMRQINTEIRSLMTGMNEQSSMMLITLKALDPQIEKNMAKWRATDTVLENVGRLLKGFGPATEILEKQWKAVSTSLDTTVTQILRGTMKSAYEDIIKLTQEFDTWLQQNKKSITEIVTLLGRVGGFGLKALIENINFLFTPIRQFIATYDAVMNKIEQYKVKRGGGVVLDANDITISEQQKANLAVVKIMKQMDAEILKNHKETAAEYDKATKLQMAAFKEAGATEDFTNKYLEKRAILKEQQFKADKKSDNADQIRRNNLAEATAENREYYDGLIEQSNHWLRMSKIGGQSDLDGTVQVINDKKIALNEWYDLQSASLIKFQDKSKLGQAVLAKDEEKLWKEYSKSWERIKNEEAETSAKIQQKAYDDSVKLMMDEINMGVKLTEESMRRPQKEADEARKMVTFYNDIRGMEAEYRNAKFEWIEKEAALKKSKGEEEVAVMRWVAQQRDMLNREYIKGVGEKFDYDTQYVKETITNTGQMLDAAMSMYDKESSEYKRLSEWKKAIMIADLAMTAAKNLQIIASNIALMTSNAGLAVSNAGTAVTGAAIGVGPLGFATAAAMIALMASVFAAYGIATGGGMSAPTSASLPASTVLGAEAGTASESMKNANSILEDIHAEEYAELQGIHQSIEELNMNITGLVGNLVRSYGNFGAMSGIDLAEQFSSGLSFMNQSSDLLSGKTLFDKIGMSGFWDISKYLSPLMGSLSLMGPFTEALFGGKTTKEITAGGISLSPATINDLATGVGVGIQKYATIKSTTSGGLFISKKESYSTIYEEVNAQTKLLFTSIYENLGNTAIELAKVFGTDMNEALNYMFPAVDLNFTGMTGEQISEKLEAWISETGDIMATALFEEVVGKYQQVGEGMYETAVRVARDLVVMKTNMDMLGMSFEGTTAQLIEYTEAMIDAAGGLENLQEGINTYYDFFFTAAEKNAFQFEMINKALGKLGFTLPETAEGFRELVTAMVTSTKEGQDAFAIIMGMMGPITDYYDYSIQIAKEYTDLQVQLMELTASKSEALAFSRRMELEAMDESLWKLQTAIWGVVDALDAVSVAEDNLKRAFDAEKENMRKIYEEEKKVLQDTYELELKLMNDNLEAARQVVDDLKGSVEKLKSAKESLEMEGLLAAMQRSAAAELAFNVVLSQARLGDFSGVNSMDKTLETLVSTAKSTSQFATRQEYEANFYKTYNAISELEALTGDQLTIEEQIVAALEKQIEDFGIAHEAQMTAFDAQHQAEMAAMDAQLAALLGIGDVVLSIADAIGALKAAQANYEAAKANAVAVSTAPWSPPSPTPSTPSAPAPAKVHYIAPNTWHSGETSDALWEQIFAAWNAQHTAVFGIPMNRPWESDADSVAQKLALDTQYSIAKGGYASGGDFSGGWRVVGEQGPELEYTGASRIFSNKDSRSLVDNSDLVNEVKQLRQELYAATYQIAKNTAKTAKITDRWDIDGLPPDRDGIIASWDDVGLPAVRP